MAAMAARTLGSMRTVTEKRAPASPAAQQAGGPSNAESIRTTSVPVHPAARAAPREEAAFPPRSLVAAITGAASGVQTVAASTFRPRTSRLLPWIFAGPNAAPCLQGGDQADGAGVRGVARVKRPRDALVDLAAQVVERRAEVLNGM